MEGFAVDPMTVVVDRNRGRLVVVALNQWRDPASCAYPRSAWPAVLLFVDGKAMCKEFESASCHLDDWPTGIANTVPGPGVWIWEGELVVTGGQTQDGEEYDCHGVGDWRRPNATETWALMRGESPWPTAKDATE